ncbi:MAG: MFS transporter [Nitrososphaerota archaeon]|nr:MFS transporter [Nitrososphaerota archaeon]
MKCTQISILARFVLIIDYFKTRPDKSVPNSTTQWSNILVLTVSSVLVMTLWFSASAVTPVLESLWNLTSIGAAWLTISVQIGFVFGSLLSAVLNISDIFQTHRVYAFSSFLGALTNTLFVFMAHGLLVGSLLRFLTGAFLAGVYPPSMKLAAGWSKRYRGSVIGALVAALTLGSASPYLMRSFDFPWQNVILTSSGLALLGGLLVIFLFKPGPYTVPTARFNPQFIREVFSRKSLRFTNFGYLGHMWELYAMWTWVPIFIVEEAPNQDNVGFLGLLAFAIIAVGSIGCLLGGVAADRIGRTLLTSVSMIASASCALIVAVLVLYKAPLYFMIPVLLFWGIVIVADSAQFSAAATELSPAEYVGTTLTLQTTMGFILTIFSIQSVPLLVQVDGWSLAFASLSIGPFIGALAMLRLRKLDESKFLANGRR